jgi:phospholipase D1/2
VITHSKQLQCCKCLGCIENLIDMALHGSGDDSYSLHWRQVATSNSDIYNEIDGAASVYICQSLNEFRAAMKGYHHRSYLDPHVREMTASIRGHLVHWPMEFLRREDLSPAMTTKAFIPLDLWM